MVGPRARRTASMPATGRLGCSGPEVIRAIVLEDSPYWPYRSRGTGQLDAVHRQWKVMAKVKERTVCGQGKVTERH